MSSKLSNRIRQEYENRMKHGGEDALYRYVLGQCVIGISDCKYPEIVILDQSDAYFSLYRRTGDEQFFIMGKVLRKAAHRLYRYLQKNNANYPINGRFLNLIK